MSATEKVVIEGTTNSLIIISEPTDKVIITGASGPRGERGINNIASAYDVDVSQLGNGATLIYDTNTSKWVATNNLATKLLSTDMTQIVDGSTLIYDSTSDSWTVTNVLQNQIVSAGFF